jgi:hypothetical protein
MQTKIGNRIVFIGRLITRKKISPSQQPIVSQRTATYRVVIIKDGEFVESRPRR